MIRAATCAAVLVLGACAHVPHRPHQDDGKQCQRPVVLVLCLFAKCDVSGEVPAKERAD